MRIGHRVEKAMRWVMSILLTGVALTSAHAQTADDRFKDIYTAEWTWRKAQFPGLDDEDRAASANDNRLPAVDAKSQKARLNYWTDVLHRLDALAPGELSAANKVNLEVYRPQVENLAASVRFHEYEMPFNSDSQFWSDLGFMANRPIQERAGGEQLHRAPERHTALFRRKHRQHARRSQAWLQCATCRAGRTRCIHFHI